jgi:hypothetical protein
VAADRSFFFHLYDLIQIAFAIIIDHHRQEAKLKAIGLSSCSHQQQGTQFFQKGKSHSTVMKTSTNLNSGVKGLRAMFGCTPEALALFRISLGCLLVCELVLRFRFLHAFYTEEGYVRHATTRSRISYSHSRICIINQNYASTSLAAKD